MDTTQLVVAAMLFVGSGSSSQLAPAQETRDLPPPIAGAKRTDLQRHDLSARGYEFLQARVDIDPGVLFARHTHPGEEIINVLQGTLEYRLEGKQPITLKAGDVLFVPAATIHSAKNVGSSTASELATYFVEKGKPLLTLEK